MCRFDVIDPTTERKNGIEIDGRNRKINRDAHKKRYSKLSAVIVKVNPCLVQVRRDGPREGSRSGCARGRYAHALNEE